METYKKKPLRFSGFAKEIRTAEISSMRKSSRDVRYSFMRNFADAEDSPKENIQQDPEIPKCSKIPVLGKSTKPSRVELLKKFQEEKLLKKMKEQVIKKPAFRCGAAKPKSLLTLNSNLSRIQNDMSFKPQISYREPQGIKNKDSTQSFKSIPQKIGIKPATAKVTEIPGIKPVTNKTKIASIPSRSLRLQSMSEKAVDSNQRKVSIPSHNNSKPMPPPSIGKTNPKPTQNKVSIPSRINSKPVPVGKTNPKPTQNKPSTSSCRVTTPLPTKKPDPKSSRNKPFIPPRNNLIKPPAVEKTNPTQKVKPVIPKPTSSKLLNKEKKTTDKTKGAVKTFKPPQIKVTGPENSATKPKVADETPVKASEESESSTKDVTFSCKLSMIEQPQNEKSFAPDGFLFCPRSEWYCSYLMDEDPTAIFARLKAEQRTSTPISKTDSNSEKKSLNSHDGSFMQSIVTEEPAGEVPGVETKNVPTESTKESNLQPTVTEIVVDNTMTQEAKSHVPCLKTLGVDLAAGEPLEVSALPSLEDAPRVAPEAQTFVLESKVPSPEIRSLSSLMKESEDSSENKSEALEVDSTPETFLLESKQVKQASPDAVFSQAECALLPKQLYESSLETCVKTSELQKVSLQVSPVTAFAPAKPASPESKGTANDFVKTRSYYRCHEAPFLERIENRDESPVIRGSTPRLRTRKTAPKDFTPRRSARLARKSKFGSIDNILDEQPSFADTPPEDVSLTSIATGLTMDLEKLHLDSTSAAVQESPHQRPRAKTLEDTNRVSLLFTPPRRESSHRKSILKDLISFSP